MEKSLEFIKRNYSPLVLAYLGDSFYETLAREYVISDGDCIVSKTNERIKDIITAVSQSKIVSILLPELDSTETWFYKSGRNARNTHHSKSAEAVEYRRATGLEALYGYLYLAGKQDRAKELFDFAMRELENQRSGEND
ncbi:MAG: ribonuclease III [Clostridia bacterium]|nr:ribonuclease III [Clostridia bacterium]